MHRGETGVGGSCSCLLEGVDREKERDDWTGTGSDAHLTLGPGSSLRSLSLLPD
jgi:hypothetical protein